MTDQHPITPPPELVTSLRDSAPYGLWETNAPRERWLINCAYAAGADQELEACVNWLADPCAADMPSLASDLRYSRRPKPTSDKELALELVRRIKGARLPWTLSELSVIVRALESL
jgi:hypothetical protein